MQASFFSPLTLLLFASALQGQVLGGLPGELTFVSSRLELPNVGIAVGDINGDGYDDIVVYNSDANPASVSAYLGDGTGYFTEGTSSPIDCNLCEPFYGILADFNGDGRKDLVIVGVGGLVFTMLGNGDGTFQPAVSYAPEGEPGYGATDVAVADLNGDGTPDFAIATYTGWCSFLNSGNATFTPTCYPEALQTPDYYSGIGIGDLNGDGIADIVYAGTLGVQSYLGDGTGKFTLKQTVPVGEDPGSFSLGDLNNDGKLDVVVRGSYLYRLFGKGDGTFTQPVEITEYYSSPGMTQIADFNGDGLADLAISGEDNFYIYYGAGGGKLAAPIPYDVGGPASGGLLTGHLRAGDNLDAIVSDFFGFSILFSTPKGFEDSVNIPVPLYPRAIAASDFNGDGLTDLIVTGETEFQVFFGTGKASQPFMAGPTSPVPSGHAIAVADFNGDGIQDVAIAAGLGRTDYFVCLGQGDGTFGTPKLIISSNNSGFAIAAGDLNGDGYPDLLVASLAGEAAILFGNGDGTFEAPVSLGVSGASPIGIADFNNDGLPDIYVNGINGYEIYVLLNQGKGKFGPATSWTGEGTVGLTACDVNRDGNMDLISNGDFDDYVLLGNGNGTFQNGISNTEVVLESEVAVACGSFTGTSYPEVVNLSEGYNLVQIMTNAGDGNLNPVQNLWGTGPGPVGMVVGKFHGQKDLDDIVVLDGGLADMNVLLNITKPK
jgi:hypothetical protein